MSEKTPTFYIHDLNISQKSIKILGRIGVEKLNDLQKCDTEKLSAMQGVDAVSFSEIKNVIAQADVIISFFEKRAQRIAEILPNVADVPVETLSLSTRSKNALRRHNIHTVGAMIQMSQKDIADLNQVGSLSQKEIVEAIENIVQCEKLEIKKDDNEYPLEMDGDEKKRRIAEVMPEVESFPLDNVPFSARAKNALEKAKIQTVGELLSLSEKDIINLRNVGQLTKEEIVGTVDTILAKGKDCLVQDKMPELYGDEKKERIVEVMPEVESFPLDNVPFSARAKNALEKAKIQTVGELLSLSEKDIINLRNVGQQTKDEIISVIDAVLEKGKDYIEQLSTLPEEEMEEEEVTLAKKGFDYKTIEVLADIFGFKPLTMTKWFDLSRQSIYNILKKRSKQRRDSWRGRPFSDREREILISLIEKKELVYYTDGTTCYCMNDKQGEFACVFIYENEIKCFFLEDLPRDVREKVIDGKMNLYTERELAGESDGRVVYVLKEPFFRPENPYTFRLNAQLRNMTIDEYSKFISGYPYIDQRSVTDEQIIAFLQEKLIEGKVFISVDPKNQWIRSFAHRHGYSIKSFIKMYGFDSWLDAAELTKTEAKARHQRELGQYIVYDNVVYLPTSSGLYKSLKVYSRSNGIVLNDYIRSLGFERTMDRFDNSLDTYELDMEVRQSEGAFEEKIFAQYPLIGSKIIKQETLEKLNANARRYIDQVLAESGVKLSLRAEMQITLAVINNAKTWKNEEYNNFWNYITLQLGYRDASGAVLRLLQSSLENAIKHNHRLFIESANGREFKATAVIHALSTRKSWMLLFDFLFDFYKNNLNWTVIPDEPLIEVMTRALRQKLAGTDDEVELTISSKAYSFQEGIRKLVLYRPVYARKLFEKLIGKIDSLINSDIKPAETYEDQLCEEWFKEKITAIANTKKAERQSRGAQRDIAIDYSRIRAKYILKNETDVQIALPDIRLKNESIHEAVLSIVYNGNNTIIQKLSWYGNELGKTINGFSISLPPIPYEENNLCIRIQIKCDDEVIFDSEESMNRVSLFFFGGTEVSSNQIKRNGYTMVVPVAAKVETENVDATEVLIKNTGFKAKFIEPQNGYVITINDHIIAFDNENGSAIKIIPPIESGSLPLVTLGDTEACLAFYESTCGIVLDNNDCLQQFILLKNGRKIDFSSLQQSENGFVFTLPLYDDEETVRLQVVNLVDEKLMYDKTYVLVEEADCCFDREFYYGESDYANAEYYIDIDDFHEVIPFTENDSEIRIPFRHGELHTEIPKITWQETSGTWLYEDRPAWYVGSISQSSFLKITSPAKMTVRFLVGGKDIMYDGKGLVAIGNVLQSVGTDGSKDANIVMRVIGKQQDASYTIGKVCFKEKFLRNPSFWFEEQKLFWDHGVFIGAEGREFVIVLNGSNGSVFEYKLNDNTEHIDLPNDIPVGNYSYEISIQIGGLFRKSKEVIASGNCVVGDKNLLRFVDRRITIDSITDEFKEEAGHIRIQPCYIDHIQFCGIEDTSEGYCPVYKGTLYTNGYNGERYEFSADKHTNKKGVTKMMVNPVRIVYINDSSLCITDQDGDGLYYYSYFDYSQGNVYALTDHEYTKVNKHKYSNADLYLYHTERV